MRLAGLAAALLLAGCGDEQDFDERFDRAEKEIASKAAVIDKELAGQASSGARPEPGQ